MKGYGKNIRYMVDYINKGENLMKKAIDPDIRDKFIAYCDELPRSSYNEDCFFCYI